jgi:hypothetical protein
MAACTGQSVALNLVSSVVVSQVWQLSVRVCGHTSQTRLSAGRASVLHVLITSTSQHQVHIKPSIQVACKECCCLPGPGTTKSARRTGYPSCKVASVHGLQAQQLLKGETCQQSPPLASKHLLRSCLRPPCCLLSQGLQLVGGLHSNSCTQNHGSAPSPTWGAANGCM